MVIFLFFFCFLLNFLFKLYTSVDGKLLWFWVEYHPSRLVQISKTINLNVRENDQNCAWNIARHSLTRSHTCSMYYCLQSPRLEQQEISTELVIRNSQAQELSTSLCNGYQTWLASKRCWFESNNVTFSQKARMFWLPNIKQDWLCEHICA